eukprot:gnl/TRDRNA2_/TRDRNA2_172662_c0_seq1.p2 gnl/TRDRNA2_/TRDRNA2_172662_c0~~gnl/TRDRNA2_/TRDRNA2_172662_c0_seq1.p2  ORF type:complete len:111 (+),score=8.16 gnl/TRDRNA2_/TRDRNA2_172662_c0_seq1:139-471(+)
MPAQVTITLVIQARVAQVVHRIRGAGSRRRRDAFANVLLLPGPKPLLRFYLVNHKSDASWLGLWQESCVFCLLSDILDQAHNLYFRRASAVPVMLSSNELFRLNVSLEPK